MSQKNTESTTGPTGYAQHYDEDRLWQKLSQMPRTSLLLVLEKALLLRELLLDSGTPLWVRATLLGALGYLILPLDLCPDFVPVAGLLDDAAMLALVLANLEQFVTDEIRERAKKRKAKMVPPATKGDEP